MTLRVFLSSTIKDLIPVRDALRETLQTLSYEPVMSDHGEVGYLPNMDTQESCYVSVEGCDLLVLVIGKRYGNVGKDGKSVTHNELRTARELGIPVYCFIQKEVYEKLQEFSAHPETALPDFEQPVELLSFVEEVAKAARNNSVLSYSDVQDAQEQLKLQLALLFRYLLQQKSDIVQSSLRDLLSEVKAIRYALPPATAKETAAVLAVARFFCEMPEPGRSSAKYHYRRIAIQAAPNVETAVRRLALAPKFAQYLESLGTRIRLMEFDTSVATPAPQPHTGRLLAASNKGHGAPHYHLYPNLELRIDESMLRDLEGQHYQLKTLYTEMVRNSLAVGKGSADS